MADNAFQQHRAGESRLLFWATGSGETIVAIIDAERVPTHAHALLADTRHVIVFTVPADATPREAARQIGAAVADLGIVRFDLLGEGAGAAVAFWLTLEPQAEIGSVVLAAPAGVRAFEALSPIWRKAFHHKAGERRSLQHLAEIGADDAILDGDCG